MKHKLGACLCEECKAELRRIDEAWQENKLKVHRDIVRYVRHMIKQLLCEEASV